MEAEKTSGNTVFKNRCQHISSVVAVVKPELLLGCCYPMNQAEVQRAFFQLVHECFTMQTET